MRQVGIDAGVPGFNRMAEDAAWMPGDIKCSARSDCPGWLELNGQAASRTTDANLFAAIGTTYGAGDGSTTFNVPNIKGRVIVGIDSGDADFDTMGETRGAKTVTLTAAQSGLPSHTHPMIDWGAVGASGEVIAAHTGPITGYSPNSVTYASSAAGASEAHNNLPPSIVLRYWIKR